MKKKTLRHIGLGFLASALITGAYEVFARGNVPISGVTVDTIFNNNEDKLKEKDQEMATLSQENQDLTKESEKLSKEISSLKKGKEAAEDKAKKLDKENASLKLELYGEDAPENNDQTSENDENQSDNTSGETVTGSYSVPQGATSSDIAQGLQEAGYISSAQEMQDLIDQWQLNEYIQANDYELSSEMSMDEILSIITNGAYYY